MAICLDCNRDVKLDTHGKCSTCGGNSILTPRANPSNITPPEEAVTADQILKEGNRILGKFKEEHCTFLSRMALLWVVARHHQLAEVPRGLFIDLALDMWDLAQDCHKLENKEGN